MWTTIHDLLVLVAQTAAMAIPIVGVITYALVPVSAESMASEGKPEEDG